jgi:predicted MFS family arabinose efflux permease
MIIIASLIAFISLILIHLIQIKIEKPIIETKVIPDVSDMEKIPRSTLSFRFGVRFQLIFSIVSSAFFSMLAPYLDGIGYPPYIYGIANFCAMILGVIILSQVGKLMDKYGPDFLYHYGWIAYGLVYLFLLTTQNVVIIILIWAWPAYVFILATEYLAATDSAPKDVLKSMTWAEVSRAGGVVIGNLIGGFIAVFYSFRAVMMFSAIGCLSLGLFLIVYQHFKN